MPQVTDTIVFDLPPAIDAAGAAALIADIIKLPQANEISLNAAAVSSLSLGYLQILVSAFKTFPKLTVSAASAEFADAFGGYGIAYPFSAQAAEEAVVAPVDVPDPVEIEPTEIEPPAQMTPVEAAPPLMPAVESEFVPAQNPAPAAQADSDPPAADVPF